MTPRACLLAGAGCLLAAQALASLVLVPRRAEVVPTSDVYAALQPGEFAGTLMLGGFRGLASDLLWMRAMGAKDQGRFYESVALFQVISQIQPRFEQIWEHMAWDMAYNVAHEVEDQDGKWSWYLAGLQANVRGAERNPKSERLLRHLAWMFHHKGDEFHERVEAATWAPLINPLLTQVNERLPAAQRLALLPATPGVGNYQLSERLYTACMLLAEAIHIRLPPYVRRMIPLAIERDGNLLRNRGAHLAALRRYLDSLERWQMVAEWNERPPTASEDREDHDIGREIYQQNEGRLRRKAAFLAEQLAGDRALGQQVVAAIAARRWDEARTLIAQPGWNATASHGHIQWLDEP